MLGSFCVICYIALTLDPQAKCIKTGPGTHTCQCLSGWREDGDECQPINNCLDPSRGGCHPNATCIYVGPGQVRLCFIHYFIHPIINSFINPCIHFIPLYIYSPFTLIDPLCIYFSSERLCLQKRLPRRREDVRTDQSVCRTEGWMSLPGECQTNTSAHGETHPKHLDGFFIFEGHLSVYGTGRMAVCV